jgi:hypothetical protein
MRIEPESTPSKESSEPKSNVRGLEKFKKPEEALEDLGESAVSGAVEIRGLEKFRKEESAPAIPQLTEGSAIIQRDSGRVYEVDAIRPTRHGERINLVTKDERGNVIQKVTLAADDLRQKLDTEGSPWSWA